MSTRRLPSPFSELAGRELVVIGNPENRRVAFWQEALETAGLPAATVVPYSSFLQGVLGDRDTLFDLIPRRSIVRIESPGQNFEVERLLLKAGVEARSKECEPMLAADELDRLEFDQGRIWCSRQWYLGLVRMLKQLERVASEQKATLLSHPADIGCMFDKSIFWQRAEGESLPVARKINQVTSYMDLVEKMRDADLRRVFVKSAHSSSASGIVALRWSPDRVQATSTVELVDGAEVKLYNSLRVRNYHDSGQVATIIDELCRHRVHVEEWLPKMTRVGKAFDLRMVVINNDPQHTVVRQSTGPLTNLHLGNERGDLEAVREELGDSWEPIRATASAAQRLFPRTLYSGVDVMVLPNGRPTLLEANAFGDLLPGVLHDGMTTYEAELAAIPRWLER